MVYQDFEQEYRTEVQGDIQTADGESLKPVHQIHSREISRNIVHRTIVLRVRIPSALYVRSQPCSVPLNMHISFCTFGRWTNTWFVVLLSS